MLKNLGSIIKECLELISKLNILFLFFANNY